MRKTMVHDKKWMHDREFLEGLGLAQILPGATGVSMMAYIGYRLRKFAGGLWMSIFYTLPATASITLLAWGYFEYGNLPVVKAIMTGFGALVVALLLNAVIHLGRAVFKTWDFHTMKGGLIALFTFVGVSLQMNTVVLILLSGTLGILFYYFTKEFEGELVTPAPTEFDVAVHLEKRIHPHDFLSLVGLFFLIGGVFFVSGPLHELFISFFHIGFFSFGGGYASIPLMQHAIVDRLQWLTLTEFRDGIALGQITPGPISMVAAFVGYKVGGVLGALVAVFGIIFAPIGTMMALSSVHARVKQLKLTRVVVKGFSTGFIGLLTAVMLEFALQSLLSWQTWLVFGLSFVTLHHYKKEVGWLILFTTVFSIVFIQ
jgi:chromate transporter